MKYILSLLLVFPCALSAMQETQPKQQLVYVTLRNNNNVELAYDYTIYNRTKENALLVDISATKAILEPNGNAQKIAYAISCDQAPHFIDAQNIVVAYVALMPDKYLPMKTTTLSDSKTLRLNQTCSQKIGENLTLAITTSTEIQK